MDLKVYRLQWCLDKNNYKKAGINFEADATKVYF
jgi:hypothetical protein